MRFSMRTLDGAIQNALPRLLGPGLHRRPFFGQGPLLCFQCLHPLRHTGDLLFRALHLFPKILHDRHRLPGICRKTCLFFRRLSALPDKQIGAVPLHFHGRECLPDFLFQPSQFFLHVSDLFPVLQQCRLVCLMRRLQTGLLGHEFGLPYLQLCQVGFNAGPPAGQIVIIVFQNSDFQRATRLLHRLILFGLSHLSGQGLQLFMDFGNNIADSIQVLLRDFEFPNCLQFLSLKAHNACCFVDKRPTILRRSGEQVIDIALFDHRMSFGAGPCFPEEAANVFESAGDLIDGIFIFAIAIQPAGNHQFLVLRQGFHHAGDRFQLLACHVADDQRHFRHTQWPAGFRPVKDDIFHAFTAKRFRALLAHDPQHGVHDITFPRAIRPYHCRHALRKINPGVEKGFKPGHQQRFQLHGNPLPIPCVRMSKC